MNLSEFLKKLDEMATDPNTGLSIRDQKGTIGRHGAFATQQAKTATDWEFYIDPKTKVMRILNPDDKSIGYSFNNANELIAWIRKSWPSKTPQEAALMAQNLIQNKWQWNPSIKDLTKMGDIIKPEIKN